MVKGRKTAIAAAGHDIMAQPHDIVIAQPTILAVSLEVEGTAELIQNRFSQKAVEQMLRKHMGISVQREAKKPREVLEEATIRNRDGRVCVPPTAFKQAMITASGQLKGLKKTDLRTALFVQGQSIPITYTEMVPRMDMVRTSGIGRVPDVRFRPSFHGWKARLTILYSDTVTVETVVDLVHRAGTVGIGEWRPQKNGDFGTFKIVRHVDTADEIAEIELQCAVPLISLRIPDWALDMNVDPQMLAKVFEDANSEAREGVA